MAIFPKLSRSVTIALWKLGKILFSRNERNGCVFSSIWLRVFVTGAFFRAHDKIHATLKFAAGYGFQFPVTYVNKVYFAVIELSSWCTLR